MSTMGIREPRAPCLPTFAEAEGAQILAVMSDWPKKLEDRLEANGLENFSEGGNLAWQAKFEHELANPREPDTFAIVSWLAEHGHISAKLALHSYATQLFEDPKADLNSLPSSMRTYLVRVLNDLIPPHPEDRSDVIRNMIRDAGIRAAVDVAAARWPLPKYNSSKRRHSAAWFVAVTWTRYGIKLEEQQVRRICKAGRTLPQRLAEFLLSGAEQTF